MCKNHQGNIHAKCYTDSRCIPTNHTDAFARLSDAFSLNEIGTTCEIVLMQLHRISDSVHDKTNQAWQKLRLPKRGRHAWLRFIIRCQIMSSRVFLPCGASSASISHPYFIRAQRSPQELHRYTALRITYRRSITPLLIRIRSPMRKEGCDSCTNVCMLPSSMRKLRRYT